MWDSILWQDIIEIIIISTTIYYSALWIKKDSSNNLFRYFFYFSLFYLASHTTGLQTINTLLFWYGPVLIIAFIIFHQETLQKNFITSQRNQSHEKITNTQWLDILISNSLLNMHHVKATTCIIERSHILDALLHTPFILNTPIQEELMSMLCQSKSYDQYKSIWLTSQGILKGVNTQWTHTKSAISTPDYKYSNSFFDLGQALVLTSKTDAIIFSLNPITRLFTLIIHDVVMQNLTAQQSLQLIKKNIETKHVHKEYINAKTLHYNSFKEIS